MCGFLKEIFSLNTYSLKTLLHTLIMNIYPIPYSKIMKELCFTRASQNIEIFKQDTGRINNIALIYQIQTYDLYIFIKLFPKNIFTIFIFLNQK